MNAPHHPLSVNPESSIAPNLSPLRHAQTGSFLAEKNLLTTAALLRKTDTYEGDILGSGVVKRTLTSTTTSALYTAAHQTIDWSAPLGPSDTLSIRIAQLSALIGHGAERTFTLFF
ncbi:hypothetical protein LY56_03399 [Roseinatronobacter thiooxidans]|uniref:Uncharacterized protein n=1 Tax=Roseinatronobacter thiooxidans TaxID=121821 RepID=A0A2W7PKC0_9RHOB|nr:hypothetical protein [Roseinatronobacter thiooxidans]PZX36714.1 hypothetical protein LY56_03399 [Roseinatronobacter thiooxidans]